MKCNRCGLRIADKTDPHLEERCRQHSLRCGRLPPRSSCKDPNTCHPNVRARPLFPSSKRSREEECEQENQPPQKKHSPEIPQPDRPLPAIEELAADLALSSQGDELPELINLINTPDTPETLTADAEWIERLLAHSPLHPSPVPSPAVPVLPTTPSPAKPEEPVPLSDQRPKPLAIRSVNVRPIAILDPCIRRPTRPTLPGRRRVPTSATATAPTTVAAPAQEVNLTVSPRRSTAQASSTVTTSVANPVSALPMTRPAPTPLMSLDVPRPTNIVARPRRRHPQPLRLRPAPENVIDLTDDAPASSVPVHQCPYCEEHILRISYLENVLITRGIIF